MARFSFNPFNPLLACLFLAQAGCALSSADWGTADPREREAWQSHMEAGEVANRERRPVEAEREFLAAVGSITTIAGNESRILEGLHRLARLYAEGGRPDAAESVLKKAAAFSEKRLGADHPETLRAQKALQPPSSSSTEIAVSAATMLGWPASLAEDDAPVLQDENQKREFFNRIDLWPVLESVMLPTGEHRTALWPVFHVTSRADGDVHSWHLLNFLKGPRYHMLLPLYYSVDDDVGILPPAFFAGSDYWTSPPLLSGSWTWADGDRATWITPFFHVTRSETGDLRSLHAGVYFQGDGYWTVPPLLTGSWDVDGGRSTWVTPLFHVTRDPAGAVRSFHAGIYFQGETYWSVPPLMTWHGEWGDGSATTWVTPLFHSTTDRAGDGVSFHFGPYLQGRDYWMLLPLAGSGLHDDGGTTTWVTPLYHRTTDKAGIVEGFHLGPYLEGRTWWTLPPLLTYGWTSGKEHGMTTAMLLWLWSDPEGLASANLCPIFFWTRNKHWLFTPAFSGHWSGADGACTWVTPFFHLSQDREGNVESFHVGPYFQGDDYWAVPPLFAWHVRHADQGDTTWITPFFHVSRDKEGNVESLHVGPYFQGDGYWAVPPLLSWHVRRSDRSETTWLTPLFHASWDADGHAEGAHVFPAFFWERDSWWAVPPLLAGGWHHGNGQTTWVTPLFHLTEDARGAARSLHVAPLFFWERNDYWVAPPALSFGYRHGDGSQSTWITPFFHDRMEEDGTLRELNVLPLWSWRRDAFWLIPPLLSGRVTHPDGARSTWITPVFHRTKDASGAMESLHVAPLYFWKRDDYWWVPPLLTGGWTGADGSSGTWVSPLYHEQHAADGRLQSRHVLNYVEGENYHHFIPLFWDWTAKSGERRSMVPPAFVRTETPNGDVTTSVPWPIVTWRTGRALDTSLGMELRPFVYQDAGEQYEFNFLWRLFSILREEKSTRVMVGPFWRSEKPVDAGEMMDFRILGGLFARDCNYETGRYRYRVFWLIPLTSPQKIKEDTLGMLDLHPLWSGSAAAAGE